MINARSEPPMINKTKQSKFRIPNVFSKLSTSHCNVLISCRNVWSSTGSLDRRYFSKSTHLDTDTNIIGCFEISTLWYEGSDCCIIYIYFISPIYINNLIYGRNVYKIAACIALQSHQIGDDENAIHVSALLVII